MKKYINVICKYSSEGQITPISIIWEDNTIYPIHRIIQKCITTSSNTRGKAIRYTCLIHNQRRYLYFNNQKWFIEK